MSDTPRTDLQSAILGRLVDIDFARQLERELAEAQAQEGQMAVAVRLIRIDNEGLQAQVAVLRDALETIYKRCDSFCQTEARIDTTRDGLLQRSLVYAVEFGELCKIAHNPLTDTAAAARHYDAEVAAEALEEAREKCKAAGSRSGEEVCRRLAAEKRMRKP